jgi:DNA mismatch endonuclease (patch repair protein)
MPCKPDLVLKKYNSVIFINGCFWHGHYGCPKSKLPTTRVEFWKDKINKNCERDNRCISKLEKEGCYVFVIWEYDLTSYKKVETLERLESDLMSILEHKTI